MATRSEYRKHYRNHAEKATEAYKEHLRYRQLRRSAEFAHHGWAWMGIECEESVSTATPAVPAVTASTDAYAGKLAMDLAAGNSKRLNKPPSLSTLSQSGSETDYEEREADLLRDPLASVGDSAAAVAPESRVSLSPAESLEREKIRRAIREIKLRKQERQPRRHRSKSPAAAAAAATPEALADNSSVDDYEEQLLAAREQRRRRKHRQQQQQQLQDQQQQQQQRQPTQNQKKRQQASCPPLLLEPEQPLQYQHQAADVA